MKIKKNFPIAFLCLSLIVLIVINPQKYINSCLNGFLIFGNKVLPALFPFFFLTKLLGETEFVENVSKKINWLTQKLFNTSGNSSYIFLMSIISGYPIGAKLTADFYEKKLINKNEAFRICTFTSTSGPLFVIGTVGIGMFGSYKIAIVIFLSHIIGAVLNGILFRNYKAKTQVLNFSLPEKLNKQTLSDCMYNAIISILLVGGFVAFFSVVVDAIFSLFAFKNGFVKAVISGTIEITRGCFELSLLQISKQAIAIISTFLISFGGICVSCQANAFLSKCEIKMGMFFIQKLSHAFFSSFVCFVFCLFIF